MTGVQLNIQLTFEQILQAVKQLSPREKLMLNDAIWSTDTEVPMEHQMLVEERRKKAKDDSGRMVDWDDAEKALRP